MAQEFHGGLITIFNRRTTFRDEIMIIGGPATVAAALRAAQAALYLDLFLANVYAMGVEQERVRRTLRLLATEVAPGLAS